MITNGGHASKKKKKRRVKTLEREKKAKKKSFMYSITISAAYIILPFVTAWT